MTWDGRERRRYPRAVFSCKIAVKLKNREFLAHTDNIGKGGVRVSLEQQLPRLMSVGLTIFLRKGKSIQCEGKVAWTAKRVSLDIQKPTLFYTGIEFTSIPDPDKKEIGKIVDGILKNTPDPKEN